VGVDDATINTSDEELFKDPPAKEDCPICFLPMPENLISCISLPPATISLVPIYDYAMANEELANEAADGYYPCCGKNICRGCIHSFVKSEKTGKCPFCNSDRGNKTFEEDVEDFMKRAAANDAASIYMLANHYHHGNGGLQQDHAKSMELYARAGQLGCSKAHGALGGIYHKRGDSKKAKFHYEAAAMAGHKKARCTIGNIEGTSGNIERAIKHLKIAASAGDYNAMNLLRILFEKGVIRRESIDSTLTAYNNSCAEMRSEARDEFIRAKAKRI
jgi:TPR repeat protein